MNRGLIQQVDTPQGLYKDPVESVRRTVHRIAADEPRSPPE